jgi:hypothetical protein
MDTFPMFATVAHSNAIKLLGSYEFIIVFLMKKQKAAHSLLILALDQTTDFTTQLAPLS